MPFFTSFTGKILSAPGLKLGTPFSPLDNPVNLISSGSEAYTQCITAANTPFGTRYAIGVRLQNDGRIDIRDSAGSLITSISSRGGWNSMFGNFIDSTDDYIVVSEPGYNRLGKMFIFDWNGNYIAELIKSGAGQGASGTFYNTHFGATFATNPNSSKIAVVNPDGGTGYIRFFNYSGTQLSSNSFSNPGTSTYWDNKLEMGENYVYYGGTNFYFYYGGTYQGRVFRFDHNGNLISTTYAPGSANYGDNQFGRDIAVDKVTNDVFVTHGATNTVYWYDENMNLKNTINVTSSAGYFGIGANNNYLIASWAPYSNTTLTTKYYYCDPVTNNISLVQTLPGISTSYPDGNFDHLLFTDTSGKQIFANVLADNSTGRYFIYS